MISQSSLKILRFAQILPKRLSSSSSSIPSTVNVTIDDKSGYAILELNRPPVNSLNLEFLQAINQKLDELTKNRINGLILTSSFEKVFCAGVHIHEMHKPDLDRAVKCCRTIQDVYYKLFTTKFPTAAAINGHSPAGGCLLTLACEYRVMVDNFKIGLNETQLGIEVPRWLRAAMLNVMSRRDTELALTSGKMFTTEEAFKVGLVDEIAESKDDALQKCTKWMNQFKIVAPEARSRTKLALRANDIKDFHKYREEDVKIFLNDIQRESFQEWIGEYLETIKKKKSN